MGTVEDIDGLRLQAEGFRYRLDKIDERYPHDDALTSFEENLFSSDFDHVVLVCFRSHQHSLLMV